MNTQTIKQTPLNQAHRQLNAKMVSFANYDMPIQYKNITSEHLSVRQNVGLFDVSHMGQFEITGKNAFNYLQNLIPSDLSKLSVSNTGLYTQLLNESGGIIDDLIIYKRDDVFLLVVNASNKEKNFQWLESNIISDTKLTDHSNDRSLLALQGPFACQLLIDLTSHQDLLNLKSFSIAEFKIAGFSCFAARTGYTGEDGFEIFVDNANATNLWDILLDKGCKYTIKPCGLGARDTLRIEAALPLYGHELDETTTPIEASLAWCVKLEKCNFIGKARLEDQLKNGVDRKLVCLKTFNRTIPRQGYTVLNAKDEPIGVITSGTMGISLGYPIAMAYVKPEYTVPDTDVKIAIRDSLESAKIVKRPFYKRSSKC